MLSAPPALAVPRMCDRFATPPSVRRARGGPHLDPPRPLAQVVDLAGAYVEGQAGNLYLEKSADLARANLTYNRLTAAALSPADSAELIARIAAEDPLIRLEPGS
jgi:hypothetical protein